jgi:hypothetical protein
MPSDASINAIMLIATPTATPNNGSAYETGINILTGQLMWGPIRRDFQGTYTNRVATGEGLYVQINAATLQRIGINFTTGQQLWISDPTVSPWGQYSGFGANAYGLSFQGTYAGYEVALNDTTGKQVWSFFAGNSGLETPYGSWPMFNGPIVGGYVVYCGYSEHTPNEPLYRGAQLFALDATTGKLLWSMPSFLTVRAISDRYLVTVNAYDNQMYVLGKGPSKTTVSAPQTAVTKGSSVMITGTVSDQSPGNPGTPAISDTSMSDWMEYLYMQKPIPGNATGVPVTLYATGPNGTTVVIANLVSDLAGKFGFRWIPPTVGAYKITATFKGSDSYGSSYDETFLAVDPAPAQASASSLTTSSSYVASTSQTPAPTASTNMYLILTAAAIAAIVIAAAVVLKRRTK